MFFLVAAALVISLSFHEFAHAFISNKLGDPTARILGRVTINPKAHLDPMGTLLLLFAGFGWGKPVPFNPMYLKNPKRDSALIAVAGPLSNVLLAIAAALLLRVVGSGGLLGGFLYLVIFYNLILGFFNLLPVNPLDGFKVVNGFLPEKLSEQWMQMAPYGVYLLLLLILTGSIGRFLLPLVQTAVEMLVF